MGVRMNVAWDDGTVKLSPGDEYHDFPHSLQARLIKSGLATQLSLNEARAAAGMAALPEADDDDLKALREIYQETFGKRPYNGWDAATLKEKIEAAMD